MHDRRVDEAIVLLLDHSEPHVLAAAAGVVVNLAGDKLCMRYSPSLCCVVCCNVLHRPFRVARSRFRRWCRRQLGWR